MILCKDLETTLEEIKKKEQVLINKWGFNSYKSTKEIEEGIIAECEFAKILWSRKKPNDEIYVADDYEDAQEHWDVGIKRNDNILLYDIKDNHSFKFKTMWAEIIARNGVLGHIIKGKADFIAFRFYQSPYHFLVCKRKEILCLLEMKNVIGKIRTSDKDKSKKPYIPYGRSDKSVDGSMNQESIVRIPVEDLRQLNNTKEIYG
jgi:hypothetical protein